MTSHARVWGWTLIAMGAVLAVVVLLGLLGLISLNVNVFGVSLQSFPARLLFLGVWLVALLVGILLVASRRAKAPTSEDR